jgi:hypothetical protein
MIGERVFLKRGVSIFGWLLLLAAIVLAGTSFVTRDIHVAVAILPALMGISMLTSRQSHESVEFLEHGLVFDDGTEISYADIFSLTDTGMSRSPDEVLKGRWIGLSTPEGHVVIRASSQSENCNMYRFLYGQLKTCGSRDVSQKLRSFLETQIETFGDERVHSFVARPKQSDRKTVRAKIVPWLAAIVTGLIWLVLSEMHKVPPAFAGWGIGLMIASPIVTLLIIAGSNSDQWSKVDRATACLVISPGGIGLVQGHLSGTMHWD